MTDKEIQEHNEWVLDLPVYRSSYRYPIVIPETLADIMKEQGEWENHKHEVVISERIKVYTKQ